MRVAATGGDHVISATLDNVTEKLTAKHDGVQLQLPPSVYYGGMDVSANTFGELIAVWFSNRRNGRFTKGQRRKFSTL